MEKKRVTQLDVAKVAGVHRGTVSLALKHHPSIPQKTRDRIIKIAEELGYQPDPLLSALAAYRTHSRQQRSFKGTLAWLLIRDPEKPMGWKHSPIYSQYYAGAKARASQYGYTLEEFETPKSKSSLKHIASVFRARNISGVLMCPQARPNAAVDFEWDDFSFVTFGYTLSQPALHTVSATQYRATVQVIKKMQAYGYRRIGLVFDHTHSERTDNNYLAGYLAAQYSSKEKPIVFDNYRVEDSSFLKMLHSKDRPDAIVSGSESLHEYLKKNGIRVPEDIGVACPVLSKKDGEMSGIFEDSFHIGEVAVDKLTNMIMRSERGIPEQVQRTLIEGKWIEGKTLPDKNKKASRKRVASKTPKA
ncbi:MAG: LacI family DNA-binding transcriptional regulator [Puniceicoccales bacterium]